jgi:hypothetical protein
MSGAPVFADGLLVGVVTTDPGDWQHGRLVGRRLVDSAGDWRRALGDQGIRLPRVLPLAGDPVAAFERRYTEYVARKYNNLTIVGLDRRDRGASSWPLDVAYLSLETEPPLSRVSGIPGASAGGRRG